MTLKITNQKTFDFSQLKEMFESVGWESANDPKSLILGLLFSSNVISCFTIIVLISKTKYIT